MFVYSSNCPVSYYEDYCGYEWHHHQKYVYNYDDMDEEYDIDYWDREE